MIKIYKTFGGFVEIPELQKDCWVNVVNPSHDEIIKLNKEHDLPEDLITDILDIDERSRTEFEDEWTLIILRIPIKDTSNGVPFHTIPLGIVIKENYTITICAKENKVLPISLPKLTREQYRETTDKISFILKLFTTSANLYLRYLKQLNQMTALIEQDLEKSIKNKELNNLLKMEKCLVYFITSIKGNEIVLARLKNSKKITTEINEDLLEDAMIENKQALEMAQIHSDILSGMMDAFASVISNNLNVVMKQLTIISIVLMIPTLVASFFGMNVPNFLEQSNWGMVIIVFISIFLSVIGVVLFRRKQWV